MKNKLILSALAVLFAVVATMAQNRETRAVGTFTKIAFRTHGKFYLKQGDTQSVEVEGTKEVLDKITTEVSDGKLIVETDKKWNNWHWRNGDDVKVYVTVKNIDAISVSGSGDLVAQTKLTGRDFKVTVSGSGSMAAELQASGDVDATVSGSGNLELNGKFANLDGNVSGSGDIEINAAVTDKVEFGLSGSGKLVATGSAKSIKATISGSGEIRAANFQVDACDVRITGSGDVQINVKSSLDANISGSGTVSYKGDPGHVVSHASGSGSVRKM